jgi:hypothetical protein
MAPQHMHGSTAHAWLQQHMHGTHSWQHYTASSCPLLPLLLQAADNLIRKYLKDKARQRVVADRGMADGDVAIIDMEVKREGERTPLPGLKKDGFFFDTEEDPLGGCLTVRRTLWVGV